MVKLSAPLRIRCSPTRCGCAPFETGMVILLYRRKGPQKAIVGLYCDAEAMRQLWYHHDLWAPFGGHRFMNERGAFCLHHVRISNIQGDVVGELNLDRVREMYGPQQWMGAMTGEPVT